MEGVTVNREQRLYVIPAGGGYTTLGFDVCAERSARLASELGVSVPKVRRGTVAAYEAYRGLVDEARKRNASTGWRSESELSPQLIGLEGWRVEATTKYGETRRFIVGRSMGWIPCHLEVSRRSSHGGSGAEYEYASVTKLYRVR